MRIENQTSVAQLPKDISKSIKEITDRVQNLETKVAEVHPEKIYDSFQKVDEFRRELYEIDLLSQNLMDAYRVYAAYAYQAMMPQQEQFEEPEEGEGTRVEPIEGDNA